MVTEKNGLADCIMCNPDDRDTGTYIALMESSRGQDETTANARLIASCPDILNALLIAEATMQRLAPDGSRATQGTRDIIKTAIRKATGAK